MPDEAKPGGAGSDPARRKARVTVPRKGGMVGKAVDAVTAPLSAIRAPELDWKLVSWGLLVLIAIILVARNWAPVRINIFGFYLDLPKALAFVIFFGLGGLTMWLVDRRGGRRRSVTTATAPVPSVATPAAAGVDKVAADIEVDGEAVAETDEPPAHEGAAADAGL